MSATPSPNGPDGPADGAGAWREARGRDSRGRFAVGNRGGPGSPYARKVAALRSALLGAVTEKDLEAVARALVMRAKAGEVPAIHELLDRLIGKPLEADLIERLERLEAQQAEGGEP